MSNHRRERGGISNKRGNRYEDFFALYRLIEFAPKAIKDAALVRLKEQAGCPVDDLLLVEANASHYHQLKADKSITWGESDRKLEKEYLEQKAQCESAKMVFRLIVVVSREDRKRSLDDNMPADLNNCTTVIQFPELARPSELAGRDDLLGNAFQEIRASRAASVTEHQHIVRAFHAAWVDHEPDTDGFCVLGSVIARIREWGYARLRHDWIEKPDAWVEAERILEEISGLQWWTDRGYLEWEYPPADQGLFQEPCASESFGRFIARLIEHKPTSFVDFERLLP